jgi:hypothetical protein
VLELPEDEEDDPPSVGSPLDPLPPPSPDDPLELDPPSVGIVEPPSPELPPSPPVPGEEFPYEELPNALLEPDCAEDPAAPAPMPPPEAIPAAEPNPGAIPASGWPKNPFTVVFASPTWISRQSSLPVIGSI